VSKLAAIRRGRSLGAKISGGRGRPWEIFFGFYKTRHVLLSNSANCTVLRAVVLTQYRRVTDRRTDGQTDRIAIASTALAMRALRRAVKSRMCADKKSSRRYVLVSSEEQVTKRSHLEHRMLALSSEAKCQGHAPSKSSRQERAVRLTGLHK